MPLFKFRLLASLERGNRRGERKGEGWLWNDLHITFFVHIVADSGVIVDEKGVGIFDPIIRAHLILLLCSYLLLLIPYHPRKAVGTSSE